MTFPTKAHSTEQTPFTKVFPSGTHLTPESTEAMQIKCLVQRLNILMQSVSISLSRNRHHTDMTNMFYYNASTEVICDERNNDCIAQ